MRPIACGMIQRLAAAALGLVACSAAAVAQPVPPPQCTVDVDLSAAGLKLDVHYRCRSALAVTFRPDSERVAARVAAFRDGAGGEPAPSSNGWSVEPRNGLVEARYSFDLGGYARAVDNVSTAVQRGEGVL